MLKIALLLLFITTYIELPIQTLLFLFLSLPFISEMIGVVLKDTTTSNQMSTILSTLSQNPHFIGSLWMLSSAVFTTYTTTSFLKYDKFSDTKHKQILPTFSNKVTISRQQQQQQQHPRKNNILIHKIQHTKQEAISKLISIRNQIARPAQLTLYRFFGSLFLGIFLHTDFSWVKRIQNTLVLSQDFFFPSICLFLANYANSIALDRIGISLTYTSKCAIPLLTVIITILNDGFSTKSIKNFPFTILSLIPIVFGIGAASWNSPTFELFGFMASLISCTAQALLNFSSKKIMREKPEISGLEAQRAMVALGVCFASVTELSKLLIMEIQKNKMKRNIKKFDNETKQHQDSQKQKEHPPLKLTLSAATAYHAEYVLSFMFVRLVEPITYGICDAIRRMSIIITGRKMFGGNPFSSLNLSGMAMAIIGAGMYAVVSTM